MKRLFTLIVLIILARAGFATVVHVENIAAYEAVPDGTLVEFDNTVTELAQYGDYLYVRDRSGCAVFYGRTGKSYYNSAVIPSGFQGVKITSNGEPMLTELSNFKDRIGFTHYHPDSITADEVGPDMFAHLVFLDSVTYQLDEVYYGYGYLGTLKDKYGNSCPILFGTMGVSPPENQSVLYNVTAVVGSSTASGEVSYHLLPTNFERIVSDDPPLVISPSQVGPETFGKNVVLCNVSYDYGVITDLNGETCEYLLTYIPILPQVLAWSYNIYGVVETYDSQEPGGAYGGGNGQETRYRVFVTGIGLNAEHEDTADVKRIQGLYNLANVRWAEYFDLTGRVVTPLTAVYQKGKYLYVKDIYDDFGLVYGDIDGSFRNGDIIEGAIAKARYIGGEWRIQPSVPSSFVKAGFGEHVYPDEVTVADVNESMIHRYVAFNNVNVVQQDETVFRMSDNTGEMMLINYFNVEFPPRATHHWLYDDGEFNIADLNCLIDAILENSTNPDMWDGTYFVEGFLSHGPTGQVVLFPIGYYRGESFDVNDDNEVNIADVDVLIDIILDNSR